MGGYRQLRPWLHKIQPPLKDSLECLLLIFLKCNKDFQTYLLPIWKAALCRQIAHQSKSFASQDSEASCSMISCFLSPSMLEKEWHRRIPLPRVFLSTLLALFVLGVLSWWSPLLWCCFGQRQMTLAGQCRWFPQSWAPSFYISRSNKTWPLLLRIL